MDVVLVGAGGAGLAVLDQLAQGLTGDGGAPGRRRRPLRVALVDPVDRLATRPADRTWCSWDVPGSGPARQLAPAVRRSWRHVAVVAPGGAEQVLDLDPLRYTMVRSEDWYALVAGRVDAARSAGALQVLHLPVAAGAVTDGAERACVATPAGDVVAPWVLDSRPHPPRRPGATSLVQHFTGQRVRTPAASVDPERAVLMDFTVPQPATGLAFGYCLPTDERTALVEHTAFTPELLDAAEHAAALAAYRARALADGGAGVVEHAETGAIPMTDAPFARRAGRRVLHLGTGGGAVRPSTGYAFGAMRRQAAVVADQLLAGADVVLPRPYPRRHAWMDALVLRALADGSAGGGAFFAGLFARNPPERVLRFLDGATGPGAELALMATAPRATMLGAVARDAAWRAGELARGRR